MLVLAALLAGVVPAGAQGLPDKSVTPNGVANAAGAAPAAAPPAPAPADTPPARRRHAKGDPFERFNRAMFRVNAVFDRLLFRPVAKAYQKVIPKLIRKALRHFFSNIEEPVVFANDLLQLRPKHALRTLGRVVVNTTVGIGGILDVAKTKDFNLPHHDNGFGNTLGRYGVGPGPYIYLPVLGPSDLRDFVGSQADGFGLRYGIGTPFDRTAYVIPHAVITGLDLRAEADGALKALLGSAVDPYATLRSAYLQDRAASIAELKPMRKGARTLDDPLTDPAAGNGAAASAPTGGPLDDPLTDPAAGAPAPDAAAPPAIDPTTTPPPAVTLAVPA